MSQDWEALAGGTLFMASGPEGDHLFVILYEPRILANYGSQEQVLLVPFCSVHPALRNYDLSCIVQQGEHPFIRHQSYIDYRNARIETFNALKKSVENKICTPAQPVSSSLLGKILTGFYKSDRIAKFILQAFPSI